MTSWNSKTNPDMPPYILGLWLGDGTSDAPAFSTMDKEVSDSVYEWAKSIECSASTWKKDGKCDLIRVRSLVQGWFKNRMVSSLTSLGIWCEKRIPHAYKTSSVASRLELLAGLIDTDGSIAHGCYDFISMHGHLADDVAFIARSVGLAAYVRPCQKKCQNGNGGTYHRVCISGDINRIPCRIARKKAAPRKAWKNVLHVGIKVEAIGDGDYFGFTLDGPDGLFLLGDFTVTHNTTLFAALAARAHQSGLRTLVLENRDRLTRQTADRIRKETGIEVDVEMGDDHASPFAPIVVGSVQTLGRVNRLTSFADNHFGLIVPDEAHFSLAPQWARILRYFHYGAESLEESWKEPAADTYTPKAKVVGFTATPDIGERKNLGEFYQHRSVNYSYLEAVNDGWLVGAEQKSIPVKVDLRKATTSGNDLRTSDLSQALVPVIEELAKQVVIEAKNRKTIAFLPSVECARLMTEALNRLGMKAIFVSGECFDADDKTDEFVASGPGTVLCNAVLYTYGVDFPDVDCIAWFRATISRAFYIQGIYRGTRVLPGVIDGLNTAEERKAAIARSKKKKLLILDPLFVSDRIDLLDIYDLSTDKPEVKAAMKAAGDATPAGAEKAERDFLATLAKEAKKHERKMARTINPIAWALSIGDAALANYVPQAPWESAPPTPGQIGWLKQQRIDTSLIKYKGLANKIITRVRARQDLNLATPHQLSLMHKLGLDEQTCATLTAREASAVIDQRIADKKAERASARVGEEFLDVGPVE